MLTVKKVTPLPYKLPFVYNIGVNSNHNYVIRPKGGTPVCVKNCHQLTPQAQQAMLKDLEEPSPHTLWLMATTDPEKLPRAFLGRTTVLNLQRIEKKALAKRLFKIAKLEGKPIDSDTAYKISEYSGGLGREAVSMLESLLKLYTTRVKTNKKVKMLDLVDESFMETQSKETIDQAMGIILSFYEGSRGGVLQFLAQKSADFSLVQKMLNMNGFIIFSMVQASTKEKIKNPYFYSPDHRMIWEAVRDSDLMKKENKKATMDRALDLSKRLVKLKQDITTVAQQDTLNLFISHLLA